MLPSPDTFFPLNPSIVRIILKSLPLKILQHYRFRNLTELKGLCQCIIHSLIKQSNFKKNPAGTSQSNRSNDQAFILKTIITTVLTLSRPCFVPLNIFNFYSLISTKINLFQRNTNLDATAIFTSTTHRT